MARRGELARKEVMDTIIKAFEEQGAYLTVQDKKIYVIGNDGGEKIQFAISLTMPKVPVQAAPEMAAGTDWRDGSDSPVQNAPKTPVSLSPEDEAAVRELMKKLGVEDEI